MLTKWNWSSLEKCLTPYLGQEMNKTGLEHLVTPDDIVALKDDCNLSKGLRSQPDQTLASHRQAI